MFVLFVNNLVLAQPVVEMVQGPRLKAPTGLVVTKIIGQDESSFYVRRGDKPWDCFIDKFDKKSLKLKRSIKVKLLQPLEFFYELQNETVFEVSNGGIMMVFDLWDKEGPKKVLYVQKIDKNGNVSGTRNELNTFHCKTAGAVAKTNYSCKFTPDKTKFVVKLSGDKDYLPMQTLTCYDTQTEKAIFTKNIESEYNGAEIKKIILDRVENNGDTYFHFYTGTDKAKNQKVYYTVIKADGSRFEEITDEKTFKEEDKIRLSGADLRTKEKFVTAGVYVERLGKAYNKKRGNELKIGVYMGITDNTTGKITTRNYTLMPEEITKKLTYKLKEGDDENVYPGEKQLVAKRLVKMNDNYYLIIEHQYVIKIHQEGVSDRDKKRVEINRELMVVQFDKEGVFKWMKIIPKYTANGGDFDMIRKDGKIYFLYLESPKNASFDIVHYPDINDYEVTKETTNNIVCTSIDDAGAVEKHVVGQNKIRQFYYIPRNINLFQDEEKTVLIGSFSTGTKAKFGTIIFH